jgi:hypothetical protein
MAWCLSPAMPNRATAGTDWRALAATARDAKLTLVIYMGVSGAPPSRQELLSGLPAHTPVAIIQHASLPTSATPSPPWGATRHHSTGKRLWWAMWSVASRHADVSGQPTR